MDGICSIWDPFSHEMPPPKIMLGISLLETFTGIVVKVGNYFQLLSSFMEEIFTKFYVDCKDLRKES
jgi:hypothetical protein